MFGKIFETLFTGSMVGAGSPAFAVWSYVITNQKPSRDYGSTVELNPQLLAFIIGDKEETIIKTIDFLCAPDPKSRSPEKQGRRLIKLGAFEYQVVNGAKYRAIRNQEERKEQVRQAVRRHRAKKGVSDDNKKGDAGMDKDTPPSVNGDEQPPESPS